MGVVYRALDPKLGRPVALKVLIAGEDASPTAIERFRREAEGVARLGHHPHIVPVYDTGQQGNLYYYAMHLVEGQPLDTLVAKGAVGPRRAAELAAKLAGGLQHAHDKGLLHRDLKPQNVLVTHAGEPQLTDFGLARDLSASSQRLTKTGAAMGSPQFMAPEQADGAETDARTDVYGLGATLYAMIAGRPPFTGSSQLNVIKKVLSEAPPPLKSFEPTVERDLASVVMRCLEKEPERRYPSAKALARDLGRYLAGQPVLAKPAGPLRKAWLWIRRNRALAAVSALLILTLAGLGLASSWWVYYRPDALRARARQLVDSELGRLEGVRDAAELTEQASVAAIRSRLAGQPPHDEQWLSALDEALRGVDSGPLLSGAHAARALELEARLKADPEDAELAAQLKAEWCLAFRHDPLGPSGARAQVALARFQFQQRRREPAIALLTAALASHPAAVEAEALPLLARAQAELGRYEAAAAALDRLGEGSDDELNQLAQLIDMVRARRAEIDLPPVTTRAPLIAEPLALLELPGEERLLCLPWRDGRPVFRVTPTGLETLLPSPLAAALDPADRVADLELADLDGDGRPSLLAAVFRPGRGGGVVALEIGPDPRQPWQISGELLDNVAYPTELGVGDPDGDGAQEAAVVFKWESAEQWIVAERGGRLEPRPLIPAGLPRAHTPCFIDVDGDRRDELLLGRGSDLDGGRLDLIRPLDGTPCPSLDELVTGQPTACVRLPGGGGASGAYFAARLWANPAKPALDPASGAEQRPGAYLGIAKVSGQGIELARSYFLEANPRFLDRRGQWPGCLDVGRLGEQPVVVTSCLGARRLFVWPNDLAQEPLGIGSPEPIHSVGLIDLERDKRGELLLLTPSRLLVLGSGGASSSQPPALPVAAASPVTAATEPARRLAAVDTLFQAGGFRAARELIDDLIQRYPDSPAAQEARVLELDSLLREARTLPDDAAGELYRQVMQQARAAATAAQGRPSLQRRLYELGRDAAAQLFPRPDTPEQRILADYRDFSVQAGRLAANALEPARPELQELARLRDGTPLIDGLVAPGLPLAVELPLRVRPADLGGAGLVVQLDATARRHLIGVPVVYRGGDFEFEFELQLEGPVWSARLAMGLVSREAAELRRDPEHFGQPDHGQVWLWLHHTGAWTRNGGPSFRSRAGGGNARPGYRRPFRVRYGFYPTAGRSWIEVSDTSDGRVVCRQQRDLRSQGLSPGRYVFGLALGYAGGDGLLGSQFMLPVADLDLRRARLRGTQITIDRDLPSAAAGLARRAGGLVVRGDQDGALAAYAGLLEGNAEHSLAAIHGALLSGDPAPLREALVRDPYGTLLALDDALRGAHPEWLLSAGALLNDPSLRAEVPWLGGLLGGQAGGAQSPLGPGVDPAAGHYLLARANTQGLIGSGSPSAFTWLRTRGLRVAGQNPQPVFWAPTNATPEQAERSLALELSRAQGSPSRTWVLRSQALLLASARDDPVLLARRYHERALAVVQLGYLGDALRDLSQAWRLSGQSDLAALQLTIRLWAGLRAHDPVLEHLRLAQSRGLELEPLLELPELQTLQQDPEFVSSLSDLRGP